METTTKQKRTRKPGDFSQAPILHNINNCTAKDVFTYLKGRGANVQLNHNRGFVISKLDGSNYQVTQSVNPKNLFRVVQIRSTFTREYNTMSTAFVANSFEAVEAKLLTIIGLFLEGGAKSIYLKR